MNKPKRQKPQSAAESKDCIENRDENPDDPETWPINVLETPEMEFKMGQVIRVMSPSDDVVSDWFDGMVVNLELQRRFPSLPISRPVAVAVYEDPLGQGTQVLFVTDKFPAPPLIGPNRARLIAYTEALPMKLACWTAAAWLVLWVDDVAELDATLERMKVNRLDKISGADLH